jgi:hypothetical protein
MLLEADSVDQAAQDADRLLKGVFNFCVLNFGVFVFVALIIGGDAISGKIIDGHFFVSQHGRLTEVSPAIFRYSRFHAFSQFVTWPIAIICAGLRYLGKK